VGHEREVLDTDAMSAAILSGDGLRAGDYLSQHTHLVRGEVEV